jgi:hypothetical protein
MQTKLRNIGHVYKSVVALFCVDSGKNDHRGQQFFNPMVTKTKEAARQSGSRGLRQKSNPPMPSKINAWNSVSTRL